MSKRVHIAYTGTYPEGMAATYRTHCYAKALKLQGTDVKVISTKSVKKHNGKSFWFESENDGVPFMILWNKGAFKSIWMNYIWAELNPYIMLLHCIFSLKKYDVLLVFGIGLIPRLILLPVLHLFGKKVVLELNEYPYSTEGSKFIQLPKMRKIFTWATLKMVIPQMDGVLAISENLKQVSNKFAPSVPVLKVPILVDVIPAVPARENSPQDNPYMFHAGTLSEQKDGITKVAEAFVIAAKELKQTGIKFNLVLTNKKTQPAVWLRIENLLRENNLLDHLIITGYLEEDELSRYLQNSSVLLINKPGTFQNTYNFPTKLGDYLLSKSPVIVASKGIELNNFLIDGENSIIVPPDDVAAMAKAIVMLCTDTDMARRIGEAGHDAALKHFDLKQHGERLKSFLNNV